MVPCNFWIIGKTTIKIIFKVFLITGIPLPSKISLQSMYLVCLLLIIASTDKHFDYIDIKHWKWVWLATCPIYQEFKAVNLHILRQRCMQCKLRLLDLWIQPEDYTRWDWWHTQLVMKRRWFCSCVAVRMLLVLAYSYFRDVVVYLCKLLHWQLS